MNSLFCLFACLLICVCCLLLVVAIAVCRPSQLGSRPHGQAKDGDQEIDTDDLCDWFVSDFREAKLK